MIPKTRFEFWVKDLSAAQVQTIQGNRAFAEKLVDGVGASVSTEAVLANAGMNAALNVVRSELAFAVKALREVKTTEAERLIVLAKDHLDILGVSLYGSY